jgi:hypothetical protein
MVVAVITMRVMEMPLNEIIGVVSVGNRFMTTARTMSMIWAVAATSMLGRTTVRVGC